MYVRILHYYITLHYRHFKHHLHLKWPVVHQQLHVIRNTAHRPSTQASYTASRVRPKRKISCAAAQIAATLTISFPRWRHMSLTSYWGQQRMSLTYYPYIYWPTGAQEQLVYNIHELFVSPHKTENEFSPCDLKIMWTSSRLPLTFDWHPQMFVKNLNIIFHIVSFIKSW